MPATSPTPVCVPSLYARRRAPRYLHSFPTRRSSDLTSDERSNFEWSRRASANDRARLIRGVMPRSQSTKTDRDCPNRERVGRSEEHTSELQSPYDLVCRLLLEKKKHINYALPTPYYP